MLNIVNVKMTKLKKYYYTIILFILIPVTLLLLSSFIFRLYNPPVDPYLDKEIERNGFEEVIQINIENACGVDGLASQTKKFMKAYGYDVMEIGNHPIELEHTVVLDRYGDEKSAKKVAYALGLSEENIISAIDSNKFVRVTVALGSDYKTLIPFK